MMFALFAIGGVMVVFGVAVLAALALLATVFWIWMLVDAIQNKGLGDGEKVGWVLAIVFLHVLGAILYLLIGHSKRNSPRSA
ncbi:MAG TPA: PLD nuclease N-terminal domain-containing protein [Verrucomicrobiae bacterium]|jgi:membrane protein implicated in regulation of membrane protease activity|nr:PLD nuclease N-terminal domain-containing protein [Verrucomicrobiae bacterium]